jgi:phosphoglycolate phosphatase-like HAD superfamily hydrolase
MNKSENPENLCVVFDIDDTVVEYVDFNYAEWYRSVAEPAASRVGLPMSIEIWRSMLSGALSRKYSERFGIPANVFWSVVDEYNLEYRKNQFKLGKIRLYDDAKIIPSLPGLKIAWSAASEKCIRFVLDSLGVSGWFDAVYGKDFENYRHVEKLKPDPGFLKHILKLTGCKHCVVVGDSEVDMAAARDSDCNALLINRKEGVDIRAVRELVNTLIRGKLV